MTILARIDAQRDGGGNISKYAWPGGYPCYAIMSDGESMCIDCVNTERQVTDDPADRSGWGVIVVSVNWDENLLCCNCNKQIESAYGEA